MNEKNIRYLIALYWLWNGESFSGKNEKGYIDTQCPLLKDFNNRLRYVYRKGFICKGRKISIDNATEYYFDRSDICSINVFMSRYSGKELDLILDEFRLG